MDLGWSDRAGARSHKLVEPAVVASRYRAPERHGSCAGRLGLEPVAGTRDRTRVQQRVFAFCLAGLVRLRLWCARRYGFLQFRHDFSRSQARRAGERGSKLDRALRRDLSGGFDRSLQLCFAWRHAAREVHLVRRWSQAFTARGTGRRSPPQGRRRNGRRASLRGGPWKNPLRIQWRESKTDSRSEDEKLQTAAENVAEITGKRTRMAGCL